MSGWIAVLLIAALTAGGILLFSPLRRQLWPAILAAIVLGLAGYASQGQPALPASPAKAITSKLKTAEALISMRADMDADYGAAKLYLRLADSYARDGDYKFAAAYINAGLRRYPKDGDLWAGLGVVLFVAGEGKMSPPAEMAFANARKYRPTNRAPDYFKGLVALFDGRPLETVQTWQQLIDGAPDKAIWKPKLESQLNGLKSMLQSAQPQDVNRTK
jgi:cytochrome c-type biogenesis protein CcmH